MMDKGDHTVLENNPLPTTTPEEAGIPSSAIIDFLQRLEDNRLCMHSFLLLRHGKVISEGYWKPFHAEKKHRMYSVTKSFVSVAIGLMEGEGLLSLDDRVVRFFPEKLPKEGVHPFIEEMTIRHLLAMTSAHEKTTYKQMKDDDWVRTFFMVPPSHRSGQIFSYDTSATLTLTAIVEKISGMPFLDYMRPRVLDPIGFSRDAYCLKTPLGVSQGGSALLCTTRDLAKFALVCMNKGKWNGAQLIPEEYIRAATSRQVDTSTLTYVDEQQGYGYQFWLCRNNGFALLGMGGQVAICLPEHDLILVTTADLQPNPNGIQAIFDALWATIYPSLSDKPITPNEAASTELNRVIDQLSIKLPRGASHSPIAEEIDGAVYAMKENMMELSQVGFEFSEDQSEGKFTFHNEDGSYQLAFGLGKAISQKFPIYNYDCLTAAAWADDQTLLISSYIIDEYVATLHMSVSFDDNTVTIAMKKYAELFLDEFAGFASGVRDDTVPT
jgi:CubicO group peptidase (beta-lactamase class C family)